MSVVVGLSGTEVVRDASLFKLPSMQSSPFAAIWSGPIDEGVGYAVCSSLSQFHQDYVSNHSSEHAASLMPKQRQNDFLSDSYYESDKDKDKDMCSWLLQLLRLQIGINEDAVKVLEVFCRRIISRAVTLKENDCISRQRSPINDNLLGTVLKACIYLNDHWLCKDALSATIEKFPLPRRRKPTPGVSPALTRTARPPSPVGRVKGIDTKLQRACHLERSLSHD